MSVVDTAIVPAAHFIEEENSLTQYYFGKPNGSCTRGVLKSKENIIKSKYYRSLKKKLKKYKLNKDGSEDPEVLDVSKTFSKSLKLRSPKCDRAIELGDDIEKRENYIIKMVRRKQTSLLNKGGITTSVANPNNRTITTRDNDFEENKTDADNVVKKQTNAFKLLMDSRNKSIGGNSPGKDKSLIEPEAEEIVEKKKNKVKRNLALQKLADAKGAVKKKELEEIQEACIKQKMEKRAERLRKMLNRNQKLSKKVRPKKDTVTDSEEENIGKASQAKVTKRNNLSNRDTKQVGLVFENNKIQNGLFIEKNNALGNSDKTRVLKEDQEFLSKLSPSIKKKENMLCYFQKLEKEPDIAVVCVDEIVNKAEEQMIKVKITPKSKKKIRHRKLSLNKKYETDVDCNENKTIENTKPSNEKEKRLRKDDNKKSRKRKRRNISEPPIEDITENNKRTEQTSEGRPKRSIKKPVKYNDDVQLLSSSDEELHVFTPKKKKHIPDNSTPNERPKRPSLLKMKSTKESEEDVKNVSKKNIKETKPSKEVSAKLAPIFKKSQIDPAALEAKQKFLQSGMPDQLKKAIVQQKVQDTLSEHFYPVVHVQRNEVTPKVSLIGIDINDDSENCCNIEDLCNKENDIEKLLKINQTIDQIATPLTGVDVQSTLKNIKESYPQFPVYRTYKTLSNKKKGDHKDLNCTNLNISSEELNGVLETKHEDPGHLTWCNKYRATSTKQILGNFDSIQELRKWLITWTSNDTSAKNSNDNSDSDFDEYDTDSRDSMRISNNLLALTGPVGSGKTSSVYAVATELSIKVIEVNVSSKRTGKILLQDLQEATQSHKVNRGKGSSAENSQEFGSKCSQNSKKVIKKSKSLSNGVVPPHKSDSLSQSQEDGRTGMSLILIDDADVVFDQDDGFVSAIAQLIQCSKRPVILVVSTLNCQHLQKFLLSGTILKMNSLSPRILGTWLDIMCLADTNLCWPGIGEKCLNYYNGDIRKAINCLHFLIASETQKRNQDNVPSISEEQKIVSDFEDENTNFSWVDHDQADEKKELGQTTTFSSQKWGDHLIGTSLNYPLDRFNVWWSVPNILKPKENVYKKESTETEKDRLKEIESISDVIDSISMADCFSYKVKPDSKLNISSNPWLSVETDSVSEKENFDNVNNHFEVVNEIAHDLVESSLNKARLSFMTQDAEIRFPGLAEQRSRDKVILRHDALTSAINPSSVLDRKALALDYWSTCRGICRSEKEKTDNNSKRHKRFTHYLKSSMVINKSVFDKLCDSLPPVEGGQ